MLVVIILYFCSYKTIIHTGGTAAALEAEFRVGGVPIEEPFAKREWKMNEFVVDDPTATNSSSAKASSQTQSLVVKPGSGDG
jgi:hypothetical protein